jgi:hypothetical protein
MEAMAMNIREFLTTKEKKCYQNMIRNIHSLLKSPHLNDDLKDYLRRIEKKWKLRFE